MREAIISETKEPICVLSQGSTPSVICPDCSNPVYFRQRVGWTDHFCHKPNSLCTTKIATNPESLQHEIGKVLLKERLSQARPDLEVRIERSLPGNSRRADVAGFRDGKIIAAYECQVSPILVRGKTGLEQRSRDYLDAGISVTWWFGERSLTATIRHWCETFFGEGTWEVIEHPQVRLEGYLPKQQGKKVMNNFLGNAIVDCVGDKLDGLFKEELLEAIEQGDTSAGLKIYTTWNEVKKASVRKERISMFESDEYWSATQNQILYILWQAKEPLSEPAITRKAVDLFNFTEELWSKGDFIVSSLPTLINGRREDLVVASWKWIIGYSFYLDVLCENSLVDFHEDQYNAATNDYEIAYYLLPKGKEAAQEIMRNQIESLSLKQPLSNIKDFPALPASRKDEQENNSVSLPSEYVEKFTAQVLSLFNQFGSMPRKELYKLARDTYSFNEEDRQVIGNCRFPQWRMAYSRNIDILMQHNYLENGKAEDGSIATKIFQITQAGRDKLAALNSTSEPVVDDIQQELLVG